VETQCATEKRLLIRASGHASGIKLFAMVRYPSPLGRSQRIAN